MTTKRSTTQKSHISLQRAAALAQSVARTRQDLHSIDSRVDNLVALMNESAGRSDKQELLSKQVEDTLQRLWNGQDDLVKQIHLLQDRVAFLTKQSSDAFCKAELNGKAVVELAKKQSIDGARISDIDSEWRQHSKVSMERYQETRGLQTSLMDTNKRLGELESRVYAIDMKKVGFAQFAQLWQHEDAHKTAAAKDYVTNPACQPGPTLKARIPHDTQDRNGNPVYAPAEDLWVAMGYCSRLLKVEIRGPFTYAAAKRFCNDAEYSDYAVLPLEE